MYDLKPNGTLSLKFGAFNADIVGGPFAYAAELPTDFLTVKLAKEINAPCSVNLPIPDFKTPGVPQAEAAIAAVLTAIEKGQPVYVGCMAGRGRTGLFLALLTKVAQDYEAKYGEDTLAQLTDPVLYVRKHYYSHAVETAAQEAFVADFDTTALVQRVWAMQPVIIPATAWTRFTEALAGFAGAIRAAFRGR